ncbi:MAG: DNA polymerase III subunit gamma/tau [bacterium]|nr:DNA polymerase III subunit gamma/tau [bacterium]
MTYYLKYRPQTIAELDLIDIRDQLLKIVASRDIPHAFLFAGPRGAGKTSAARILAKAVNCEKPGKDGEPCNKCAQCEQINKGSSLDIVELDAASHRGVEDIRSLRDAVSLAPASAKKKVYIIDEAHMLTTEASNALLKTLEEPPAHVLFVLATTAPEKLLDTIRSRAMTLVFRKAGEGEVVQSLKKVVAGEDLEIEKGVLEEIAKRVDGSFREAHKILEQLSIGEKKLTLVGVQASITGGGNAEELTYKLVKKDTKGALQIVLKASEEGANMKVLSTEVVSRLREGLLVKLGAVNGEEIELEIGELEKLLELFAEAAGKTSQAVIPSLPLEMAIIRCGEGDVGAGSHSAHLPDKQSLPLRGNSEGEKEQTPVSLPAKGEKKKGKVETLPQGDLEGKWKEMLKMLGRDNFSIEALLRAARPAGFDGKVLQVEVFYGFHKERLEKDQYRKVIEQVACDVLGADTCQLVCILSTTKKRALDGANVTENVDQDIVKIAEEIFAESPPEAEGLPN